MQTRLILFDVGGVLVELGGVDALLGWMGSDTSVEQLWPVWLRSPSVRAFETGRIEPMEFAVGILAELKLTIAPQTFIESFASWPTRPYPGALQLVASIPARYQRALLSNSNMLHWPRVMDDMDFKSSFEHCFSSHLTGKIKPDAECFEHVIESFGCQAEEVLFLDDNMLNVQAARTVGMRAEQARGVEGARLALQRAGVIG
jgi:HAD superfamily hydrolase (TIGR01509 family)